MVGWALLSSNPNYSQLEILLLLPLKILQLSF